MTSLGKNLAIISLIAIAIFVILIGITVMYAAATGIDYPNLYAFFFGGIVTAAAIGFIGFIIDCQNP